MCSDLAECPQCFFDRFPWLIGRRDLQITWLHPPNLGRIFCNCAVAGEFPRSGNVPNYHLRPLFLILKTDTVEGTDGVIGIMFIMFQVEAVNVLEKSW